MKYKMPEFTIDYEVNKLDVHKRLSDQMRKVIDFQNERSKDAFVTGGSWEDLRERYDKEREYWNEGGPDMQESKDFSIPGIEEGTQIGLRIHYPTEERGLPAIVFIHGGGFTVGNINTHDRIMRSLAHHSGLPVIGVNYQLAPEKKFPYQLYECVEVLNYFHEHGEEYGIDPNALGMAGDSGGANLSLSVNLFLRDTADNSFIKGLALYYGGFGLREGMYTRLHGSALDGMRYEDLKYYAGTYLEDPADAENPYYCTANNDLTHGIPPTYLACSDIDPLTGNTLFLYEVLKENNIESELEVHKGLLHGYMHYSRMIDDAADCLKESAKFLRKALMG